MGTIVRGSVEERMEIIYQDPSPVVAAASQSSSIVTPRLLGLGSELSGRNFQHLHLAQIASCPMQIIHTVTTLAILMR